MEVIINYNNVLRNISCLFFIFNDLFDFFFLFGCIISKQQREYSSLCSLAVSVVMPMLAISVLLPSSETDVRSATCTRSIKILSLF